jgi:Ca-activated chloride channel family protein
VIVFGKWRGLPQGRITLTGRTGNAPYSTSINVNEVKPLASNAALRYLWARHRLTLLADYNNLQPGNELVEEATNLGLKYNLLTAYTSFVAVDSKARRDGGKLTTVSQPLPLPQGVSDDAVGALRSVAVNSGMLNYQASGLALPVTTAEAQSVSGSGAGGRQKVAMAPKPEAIALTKLNDQSQRKGEAKTAEKDARQELEKIKLVQIVVNGGISKERVQQAATTRLNEILACYQQTLQKQPNLQGKLAIKLTIAANGLVSQVIIVSEPANDKTFVACLTQKLKQWRFAGVRNQGEATITYELKP